MLSVKQVKRKHQLRSSRALSLFNNVPLRTRRVLLLYGNTVKPRPEAHIDMILFEVFLKSIDLIPQQQILQRHYLYYR